MRERGNEQVSGAVDRSVRVCSHGVVKCVQTCSVKVTVSGHTDSTGSASANQTLSEARAKSVVGYLVAHGVAQSRITATGYGGTKPVASNATEEGRGKNRRIEFSVAM
jgi:OOP family OmpA-OmpF porin